MPIDPSADPIFDQAAPQYNVDPDVLRAMHLVETGGTGRWDQTSKAGAQGGMQFLPETAARYKVQDPTDPTQAIPGAAHYISDLLAKHEGNAGPGWPALQGALNEYSGGAPGYADKVLQYYNQLKAPQPQQQPAVDRGTADFAKQSGQLGDPTQPGWAEQNLVTINGPNGVSFQVHKLAAPSFQGFVDDLARSGYPISSGGGYNFRNIRGGSELSEHAFGNAIDINPQKNPMGPNLQTDLPPNIGDLAAKWGLSWGGDWHSRKDPMHFEWTGVQTARNGAKPGMDGLDALAASGQQAPPPDALLQLAQASGPQAMPDISKLSDDDIATGLLNGSLRMPKGMVPAQAPQSAAPSASVGTAAPQTAPPAPSQAPQSTAAPALDVPGLIDTYNRYRSFPAGLPLAQGALGMLQKMAPEGYVLGQDGSLSLRPGMAQGANALKANEAAGTNLETIGPNGAVAPLPGAAQSAQTMANAKAEGEQGPVRQTQAIAPQQQRGAGSSITYPLGSPVAKAYGDLQKSGALPQGVTVDPSGTVTIANMNPASETIGKNFETLDKMEAESTAARLGLYQAQLLKDRLAQIGTSGPATQSLGALASWAQQAGVPPETLKKFALPEGANVEQANSLALGLLGEGLRATFPQRITNTDISTFKPSSPNVNMLSDASNYLIDKVVVPKMTRDIERYGYATGLPQNDPQEFKSSLFKWDQDHPYSAYAQANAPAPKRLIWNPTTNALEPAKQ